MKELNSLTVPLKKKARNSLDLKIWFPSRALANVRQPFCRSVIGRIEDFESAEKLASYFGIVPRVANSNETVKTGRIHKRGSKTGRTTLVQCTLVALRYSEYLQQHYAQIKQRRGAGKAIIAAARKFLAIIYNTLKQNWVFADFGNFVLAQ